MPPNPIRVLVVYHVPSVLDSMLRSLESLPRVQVVGTANSNTEALTLIDSGITEPHVILLDMTEPSGEQVAVIGTFHDKLPNTAILAIVSQPSGNFGEEARQAGAIGYLSCNRIATYITEAVLTAYNAMPFEMPDLTAPATQRWRLIRLPNGNYLNPWGRYILHLMAQGLRNQQIAEQLHITPPALKRDIRSLHRKLGTKTRAETIRYAISNHLVPGN